MRKINRRNFLKAAGVLSAAVAGSLLAGCGGSDTGAGAAASDLPAYNELTVGTDHTDLTATIKVINHRSDLIQEGTFDGYVAEFQKLYPNITIEYEGITDYAGDMTTRADLAGVGRCLHDPHHHSPDRAGRLLLSHVRSERHPGGLQLRRQPRL